MRNLHAQRTSHQSRAAHQWLYGVLTALFLMLLVPLTSKAFTGTAVQVSDSVYQVETTIYFPYGKGELDMTFRNNKQMLESFVQQYQKLRGDASIRLSAIKITGTSSPDGSYTANQRIAKCRAESMASYLRQALTIDDSQLDVHSAGIYWDGILAAADTLADFPQREVVKQIIRDVPEISYVKGVKVELRKQRLIHLDDGRVWQYLHKNVFSDMRSACARLSVSYQFIVTEGKPQAGEAETKAVENAPAKTEVKAEEPAPNNIADNAKPARPPRHAVMAIRSNL